MNLATCPNGHFYDADKFSSCPTCTQDGGIGATVAVQAPAASWQPTAPAAPEYGATVAHDAAMLGYSPVAGWLVCVDGCAKGGDFRLTAGYNYIGRDKDMQVRLEGDEQVSRRNHALVAYDDRSGGFYFGPSSGINMVYLNDKAVLSTVELHDGDVISIGGCRLVFVPFCGERFKWDD